MMAPARAAVPASSASTTSMHCARLPGLVEAVKHSPYRMLDHRALPF
ncbi:hypothetical protein [Massilia genomosp. 1]|nr:hypothetical protein [Massilia genomosp. 1]